MTTLKPHPTSKPQSWTLTEDRVIHGTTYARRGDVVYRYAGYDYGLSSDDERGTGEAHRSVTLDPGTTGTPFFTCPLSILKPKDP